MRITSLLLTFLVYISKDYENDFHNEKDVEDERLWFRLKT